MRELGISVLAAPTPLGAYAEAMQTGNLLFLSGMLPTEGRELKFAGRVGAELDVEAATAAAPRSNSHGTTYESHESHDFH